MTIALVGEAWGEAEERLGHPFVGPAGRELVNLLADAGYFERPQGVWEPGAVRDFWLQQGKVALLNVFNLRPKGNDIDILCAPRTDSAAASHLPQLRAGRYIQRQYLDHLDRLARDLSSLRPNVVVGLGNTAAWALLGNSGIAKIRGTVANGDGRVWGGKVLPTYHPAAILRDWSLRHVTVLDLAKALRESEFPEIRRPQRKVYVPEELADLGALVRDVLLPAKRLAVDIETVGDQITCIGFAPSTDLAVVVPITDFRQASRSYWPSHEDEILVWRLIQDVLAGPSAKVFQNGLYDLHFLWRRYGLTVANCQHDTMLLHHALQPESPKGLDFLGSVYTNEAAWKLNRPRGKMTIKKED